MAAGQLRLPAAAATQRRPSEPAHSLRRPERPVVWAVAPGRHVRERRLAASWPLSPGGTAGSHMAGSECEVRSPASNPRERLYPPLVDRDGAFGFCVAARRPDAHHKRRAPESGSETLVVPMHLKARPQMTMLGTGVWSVAGLWLGARAWAGGLAHVASAGGTQGGHVLDCCAHGIKFGNVRSPRALARFRLDRSERFPRVAGTGIKVENAMTRPATGREAGYSGFHYRAFTLVMYL